MLSCILTVRPMQKAFKSCPRIFVVDDELDIAQMLCVILQMNLFDAVPYIDPWAALQAARVETPEYLVSDVMMPGMNGIELAKALQRELPACKVLLFSGHLEAAKLIAEAKKEGHNIRSIDKPIHPSTLVAAIRNL